MAFIRQSWVNANQFTPSLSASIDFEVNTATAPLGSTLTRTWVDVRFNRIGIGDPPEVINECGPMIWGLCYYDQAEDDPAAAADDDGIDWLWREMIAFGPAVTVPELPAAIPVWTQVSVGPTGQRDCKGKRTIRHTPAFLHFCFNLPTSFSSTPPGIGWEVFVHTLWQVP